MAVIPDFLALVVNQLGVNEVARLANVTEDDVLDAVYQARRRTAQTPAQREATYNLERFVADVERGGEFTDELDIDLDQFDEWVEHIEDLRRTAFIEPEMLHNFRTALMNGNIKPEYLDIYNVGHKSVWGLDVFNDLTLHQSQKLLEFAAQGGDLNSAIEGYLADDGEIFGKGYITDITQSQFWAWYRENIYGDADYDDR